MRVLFVCLGNVSRSQMAEALYNSLTSSNDAFSAGVRVGKSGQTLADRRKEHGGKSFTLDVMKDAGLNIESKPQTQLTIDMLGQYDLVISMAGKRYTPQWLANAPNYTYWKVTDPRGRSYTITANAKNMIEQKIRELIAST